jgi:CheY-like chemotaxis protein
MELVNSRCLTDLIVEDVEWIRLQMKKSLEGCGYYVVEAVDIDTALAIADLQPVDLILTEEDVPGFDSLNDRKNRNPSLAGAPVAIIDPDAEEGSLRGGAFVLSDYGCISRLLAGLVK